MAPLALLFTVLAVSAYANVVRRVAPATTGALETEILPNAQFSVSLAEKVARPAYKKNLLNTLRQSGSKTSSVPATLAGSGNDVQYLTDITVGGQTFKVIVDTGSSDTWLVKKSFKCYNLTSYPEPQSECGFGTSGFDESQSTTFVNDPNKNFNISYGDGEFLTGVVGFETVTVGGMSVTQQEISFVTDAAWSGDGVNSGLMGFAYSGLTSVYTGTNPDKDSSDTLAQYSPIFFTAVSEKVVTNPYFSIALSRGSLTNQESSSIDPNLGYLAFGGIAPVNTTVPAVTIPVQGYAISSSSSEFFYYNVDIDAYVYTGSPQLTGSGKQAILDTGTFLNYVPTNVAKTYNAKFVPPATFNKDKNTYFVDCSATAPDFEVQIGGSKFKIDAKDQILPAGTDSNGNAICISGTQDGGDPSNANTVFIMGDIFLHNVVATFNINTNQVTLTQRAPY